MGFKNTQTDTAEPTTYQAAAFADMPTSATLEYPRWSCLNEPLLVDRGGVDALRELPPSSRDAISTVIRWFRENKDAASEAVASYCVSVEPELRARPQDYETTRLSAIAVIDRMISGVEAGQEPRTIPTPVEVLEFARIFARRKMPLSAVQRSYHLGNAWFTHQWSVALGALLSDANQVREAITSLSLFFFVYVDSVTSAIADEYVAEMVRWTHSSDARRLRIVQDVINDASNLSAEQVSRELDWSVTATHVGVLAWSSGPHSVVRLDDFCRLLTKGREHSVLRVRPDDGSELWMWLHVPTLPEAEFFDKRATGRDINLAVGDPAQGIEGFRRTFGQARMVRRVADLPTAPRKRTWLYRDHQLAVLAAADVPATESFIKDQLGHLVTDEEGAIVARHALEVYLASDMNRVRAANALHVHRNTLAYRLDRAAELRGRPLSEEWLEMAAALNLLPLFIQTPDR